MKKQGILAFDYGASSGRLILGIMKEEAGLRKIDLEELHRFKNRSVKLNKYECWDFLYLYSELREGLKKAFADDGIIKKENIDVLSVGVDTWGVDYGWLDENGELIANPVCYRDIRTEEIFDEVHSKISKEEIFKETGIQFNSFNTLYQIYYDIHKRKILEKGAKKIQFLPNLFTYFLTGKMSWEYTIASTSGMLNAKTKNWSEKIFKTLDIPMDIVGEIKSGGQVLGEVKQEILNELGINKLNVSLTTSHDSAGAIAGAPLEKNTVSIINGTWSILGLESDVSFVNDEAFRSNIANEGGIENKTRVLKMIPGLWMLQQLKGIFDSKKLNIDYPEFGKLASESSLKSFADLESERFLHTKNMEKELQQYCEETNQEIPKTNSDLLRVAYNSLKKQYNKSILELEKLVGIKFEKLVAIGGGIQDKFLCQEVANEVGRNIEAGPIEASAFGNIVTQFIATGLISNLKEGREIIKNSIEIVVYRPERRE